MHHEGSNRLVLWALVLYAGLLIHGSLLPYQFQLSGQSPFTFLLRPDAASGRVDMLTNFMIYVPLGFLLAWSARNSVRAVVSAAVGAGVLSLAMETLQSFMPERIASRTDVLMDVVGAIGGAVIAGVLRDSSAVRRQVQRFRKEFLKEEQDGATQIGVLAIVLWVVWQLTPFVPRTSVHAVRHSLSQLLNGTPQFGHSELLAVLAHAGAAAALSLLVMTVVRREKWFPLTVAIVGLVTAAKPLIVTHVLTRQEVAGSTAGVVAAYLICRIVRTRGGIAWTAVALLGVGLVASELTPHPGGYYPFQWVPFAAEFTDTLDGIDTMLAVAWGAMACAVFLAVQHTSHRWLVRAGTILLPLVTLVLEWNQRHITGRVGDTTGPLIVLVFWAGTWLWVDELNRRRGLNDAAESSIAEEVRTECVGGHEVLSVVENASRAEAESAD